MISRRKFIVQKVDRVMFRKWRLVKIRERQPILIVIKITFDAGETKTVDEGKSEKNPIYNKYKLEINGDKPVHNIWLRFDNSKFIT